MNQLIKANLEWPRRKKVMHGEITLKTISVFSRSSSKAGDTSAPTLRPVEKLWWRWMKSCSENVCSAALIHIRHVVPVVGAVSLTSALNFGYTIKLTFRCPRPHNPQPSETRLFLAAVLLQVASCSLIQPFSA